MGTAGDPWPAYRRALRRAWTDAGGDDAARVALVDPADRRRAGRHHTPPAIADGVVAMALDMDRPAGSVCDPSVGGGAFLLAYVRAAVAAGLPPADAVSRCHGCDL